MSRRLGGKRTISKYDMKIQRTIEGFFINLMVREFDMKSCHFQSKLKMDET